MSQREMAQESIRKAEEFRKTKGKECKECKVFLPPEKFIKDVKFVFERGNTIEDTCGTCLTRKAFEKEKTELTSRLARINTWLEEHKN